MQHIVANEPDDLTADDDLLKCSVQSVPGIVSEPVSCVDGSTSVLQPNLSWVDVTSPNWWVLPSEIQKVVSF